MKRTYLFALMLCSLVIVSSCKKDEDTSNGGGATPATKYEVVELSTIHGNFYIWLYDETPLHKANFLKLAKEGFYDGTTFHRLVTQFVMQGGDPNSKDSDPKNDGQGGPGYTIPAEINANLKHDVGMIGAARDNNPEKRSSGSQFYICLNKDKTAGIDGGYTVFGKVIKGMENSGKIMSVPFDQNGRPLTDLKMTMKVIAYDTEAEVLAEYGFTIPK